jgi:energy-coupling factor transporter transmembrane protein EcfT
VLAALISKSLFSLLLGCFVLSLILIVTSKTRAPYLSYWLVVLLPLATILCLIWGLLIGAPPDAPAGSDQLGGIYFALKIILRLAILGGVTQLFLLTVEPEDLPQLLYQIGIRGELLIVLLGSFALGPELTLRADQVMTARLARGMMPNRGIISRIYQLPFILRPLFAWALRSAIQRSENWHQKQIFSRVENFNKRTLNYSIASSTLILLSSASYLVLSLAERFKF